MKLPEYSKITALGSTLLLLTAAQLNAQITWDGDGGDSFWSNLDNWNPQTALPTGADDVTVNVNTNLRNGFIVDLGTVQTFANTLTLDPTWVGGNIAVRGQNALNITAGGSITITANYTDNSSAMFAPNTSGNLTLRTASNNGDLTFVNNSATEVAFVGNATRLVIIAGSGGPNETVDFDGSGNFLMGDRSIIAGNTLERVWTADTFTGTLTLNSTATDAFNPSTDFRILGGTLKIGADNQIGDSTAMAFGTAAGITGTLDARGITETAGVLNNFSDASATLAILVDGSTSLTFANSNDGGQDRGDIDVQGWVEGSSGIVFSSLSTYDWTVAEGAAFVQLTLDGNTAYMTEVGTGTGIWAVTANPSVTVPTAPILSIVINGNDAEISFAAEDGLSYQLQKRTSLTSGVWDDIGSPVVNSGGGTETLIDTGTLPTNTEGFYQVIVN